MQGMLGGPLEKGVVEGAGFIRCQGGVGIGASFSMGTSHQQGH
jgi:hypothetical protein